MGLIWLHFSPVSHLILPGCVKVIVSIVPEEAMINTRKFWSSSPSLMNYQSLGEFTPPYILHTCAFGTYLLGGYLSCIKDYKVMVFYM